MPSSFLANIPSSVEIPVPYLLAAMLTILVVYYIKERQLMPRLQETEKSLSGVTIIETKAADIVGSSSSDTSSNDDLKPITPECASVQSRISRSSSYRMEEECLRKSSSEYTRRGQLWSKHASWNLPKAPRLSIKKYEKSSIYPIQGLEHVFTILERYNVDPRRGFLPSQDPLQRLPYARYHLWEDLADDLPKLLGARLGQARGPLRQLPALKTDKLVTDAELRRAHLLLCIFAHAYIWGGPEPMDEIPEGIAIPLWEVAKRLDMPPVLGHPSIVLYNWRRLDAEADICMENLSTLNNFFDGRDESWFYLITVELEQRGASSVVPMMLLIDAIQRYKEEAKHLISQRERTESTTSTGSAETLHQTPDPVDLHSDDDFSWEELRSNDDYDGGSGDQDDSPREEEALLGELTSQRVATYVTMQLKKIADAIMGMVLSMGAMREGCHPFIFYNRVRPFLSAWKNNPTLPNGVIYKVSLETTALSTGNLISAEMKFNTY
jgi:Indoleamine 2,3-dioxygenase